MLKGNKARKKACNIKQNIALKPESTPKRNFSLSPPCIDQGVISNQCCLYQMKNSHIQFILVHELYFTFEKNTPRGGTWQGLHFAGKS